MLNGTTRKIISIRFCFLLKIKFELGSASSEGERPSTNLAIRVWFSVAQQIDISFAFVVEKYATSIYSEKFSMRTQQIEQRHLLEEKQTLHSLSEQKGA